MTCEQVQQKLSLYLYGELSFSAEDELEQHLSTCSYCQLAYRREKGWHAALQSEREDVPFSLLSECRQSLKSGLGQAKPKLQKRHFPVWRSVLDWLPQPAESWSARLATISFLVILGFVSGRWTEQHGISPLLQTAGLSEMGLLGAQSRVRDVRPEADGQVRIIVDQVHERELVGRLQDSTIRQMVLAAAENPGDPALRVDSITVLTGQNGADVRDALVRTVRHDSNAAVRLKAVEGLRAFSDETVPREALKYVLEHDEDPGVRSEAIDVLAATTGQVEFSPEFANTLQEIIQRENGDAYVRMRCLQILRAMNATPGVY